MKLSDATEQFIDETDSKQPPGRSLNATRHGAFSYLNRTKKGEKIPRDLALVESAVAVEVEEDGPLGRIRKQAVRLATASELLWFYMASGPEAFSTGLRQWGWLAGAEIRAWREHEALRNSGAADDEDADDASEGDIIINWDGDASKKCTQRMQ